MSDHNSSDETGAWPELQLEQQQVKSDLDPHLQEVILAERSGEDVDPSVAGESASGASIVDVLAELVDATKPVPGLDIVANIEGIVTGTVAVNDIESVKADANVRSLKRATRLYENLEFSLGEVRATGDQIREGLPNVPSAIDGSGVIVGVVDYGCDFASQNFRRSDGSTRLLYLWDQRSGAGALSPADFGYGREWNAQQIDQALQSSNPYTALSYSLQPRSHGTHVLDIAAGNGRGTGFAGMAPGADLIFVEVAAGDYGEEESFGNSRRLLEAVLYVFRKAEALGRPAVVNLSLGTHGGPHDGSTLVEKGFDRLLDVPGRAIVISAGNAWERASHASGTVQLGQPRTLTWEILPGDTTPNELEVWYPDADALSVTLVSPTGKRLGPVTGGQTTNITAGGTRVGRIIHRLNDSSNGDNHIDILPELPAAGHVDGRARDGGRAGFLSCVDRAGRPGPVPVCRG